MTKRKVCVVVTARPSYSRIKTALKAIHAHPKLELQLVVAASALLDRYGTAVEHIEKDGFQVSAKVFNVLEGEDLTAAAKTTGIGIIELSSVFMRLQPDMVVTVADRFETMATALSAAYMNIPLVHVQGGEVTGNIDEKVRHAITKLADIHLVSSAKAKERLVKMGEDPSSVYLTGCPSIDIANGVARQPHLDFDPLEKYGGVGQYLDLRQGYLVVMQHPVTTEYEEARSQIEVTLQAVAQVQLPTLWFWPNVDAGSDGTSKGIRAFREHHPDKASLFHFFKNMDPEDFLRLLINSKLLIGNSSVGIRECAFLGIPVVNIGSRQLGRERGGNVIDCKHDVDDIFASIQKHLTNGKYVSSKIYGQGDAGTKIASILSEAQLKIEKRLQY